MLDAGDLKTFQTAAGGVFVDRQVAEYAVALYQYMRLLGYPAAKISILAAYAGQKALIRDVLAHRCKGNRLFGMPGWLGTLAEWNPVSSTASATRELFGNPGWGGVSWADQHALLLAVAWPLLILAVFLPLAVYRWQRLSR